MRNNKCKIFKLTEVENRIVVARGRRVKDSGELLIKEYKI
jgi:hypothetical protein